MSKVAIIDKCEDCPHFDNHYYTYNEVCTLLGRIIKSEVEMNKGFVRELPHDCPLDDAK